MDSVLSVMQIDGKARRVISVKVRNDRIVQLTGRPRSAALVSVDSTLSGG